MKKILFITIIALTQFALCTSSTEKQNVTVSDSIIVVFWKGCIDFSVAPPCSSMSAKAEKVADTIIAVEKDVFMKIKKAINGAKSFKRSWNCISKIYVKTDSAEICICDANMVQSIHNEQVYLDLYMIYLIKWKSGYYNYIEKEFLHDFEEIRKYGIPKDYKYAYTEKTMPPYGGKPTETVILIKE